MRILLISSGPHYVSYLMASELNKYCETKIYNMGFHTKYDVEVKLDSSVEYDPSDEKKFDIVLGIDHGCLPILLNSREFFKDSKFGVQILDYPKHVLDDKNKCYSLKAVKQWEEWKLILPKMDFILYNKKNSAEGLGKFYDRVPSMQLLYPIITIPTNEYSNDGFIVHSGRLNEDRRADLIINAIAKSKSKPKLIIATVVNQNTIDFSKIAKELGIEYEVIDGLSEEEKFKLYARSCFVISANYSYCPAGCVRQAEYLGKNALCFETSSEHLSTYGPYIEYGNDNIDVFAEKIDLLYYSDEYREKFKQQRIDYFNANSTYRVWGEKVYNFVSNL